MYEEALQIALKRIEVKSKGEKERYTHLNAEFQSIARRDKKALSEQYKEIEENILFPMGKTSHLSRKVEIQGNISCKYGLNKYRNGMDLTDRRY